MNSLRHLIFTATLMLSATISSRLHAVTDNISLSGNPAPLNITTAVAGSGPAPVVQATTYNIETGLVLRRIVGQLNANMPSFTSLIVEMQAPLLATSAGPVAMDTTARNLVTNLLISALPITGLSCTYTLTATVQAAPTSQTRTITFSIVP